MITGIGETTTLANFPMVSEPFMVNIQSGVSDFSGPGDTTTLQMGGGYVGAPTGLIPVETKVSPFGEIGNWIQNNMMLVGVGVIGLLIIKSKR